MPVRHILASFSGVQLSAIGVVGSIGLGALALQPVSISNSDNNLLSGRYERIGASKPRKLDQAIAVLRDTGFIQPIAFQQAQANQTPETAAPSKDQVPTVTALVSENGQTNVYLRHDGKVQKAVTGDVFGPWTVETIESDSITFLKDGEIVVSNLFGSRDGT